MKSKKGKGGGGGEKETLSRASKLSGRPSESNGVSFQGKGVRKKGMEGKKGEKRHGRSLRHSIHYQASS